MSIEHDKKWEDLQELRRIYCLKDARTPSMSFTVHWLQLERTLDGYRKDIQELNRLFALEDPRSKGTGVNFRCLENYIEAVVVSLESQARRGH